jgi:hypothetical protein
MDRRPFADVGGKADMPSGRRDVCLGPRADIVDALGGRRLYSCRQIFTAEIKRIAASIGSSAPFGTIPSNNPPMNVPTIEPAAGRTGVPLPEIGSRHTKQPDLEPAGRQSRQRRDPADDADILEHRRDRFLRRQRAKR